MIELPKTPSMSLNGRKAIITGASSGIGLGCAVALAEAGAHVCLSARNSKNLNKVVEAIQAKGMNAEAITLDVSDVKASQEVILTNGPFDVLVNSAGSAHHTPSKDTNEEDFDDVMNVNLRGAYFVTQAVAKGLIQNKKPGSLINISSQMGHVGGITDLPGIVLDPESIKTNIIYFDMDDDTLESADFLVALSTKGIQFFDTGPRRFRMVTHYGITAEDILYTIDAFKQTLAD